MINYFFSSVTIRITCHIQIETLIYGDKEEPLDRVKFGRLLQGFVLTRDGMAMLDDWHDASYAPYLVPYLKKLSEESMLR